MADKITRAMVTAPTFINGVLHMPGEIAAVDLNALGVKSLDDDSVKGLAKVSAREAEAIIQTPIAAVAPHAPDAPNPQGLPTGTVQSGTGRLVQIDSIAGQGGIVTTTANPPTDADDVAPAVEPVGADKPGIAGEQTPTKKK